MDSFNFLHHGPGGNASAERRELGAEFPASQFWVQPRVKGEPHPFKTLVRACADHLGHFHEAPVVAHGFGCDLLLSALNSQPLRTGPLVLISPLVSIPQGLYNLALVLQKKNSHLPLEAAARAAQSELPDLSVRKFWSLANQLAAHPDYPTVVPWPPFDLGEWQAVLQDFLFSNPPTNYNSLKQKNAWVVIGAKDPYFNLEMDLPFWRALVGGDRVVVFNNCGVYPHIENKQEFIDLLKLVL